MEDDQRSWGWARRPKAEEVSGATPSVYMCTECKCVYEVYTLVNI